MKNYYYFFPIGLIVVIYSNNFGSYTLLEVNRCHAAVKRCSITQGHQKLGGKPRGFHGPLRVEGPKVIDYSGPMWLNVSYCPETHRASSSSVSSRAFSVSRLSSSANCSRPPRLSSSSSLAKTNEDVSEESQRPTEQLRGQTFT